MLKNGRYKKGRSFGASSLISEELKVKKVKHPTTERGMQVPAGNISSWFLHGLILLKQSLQKCWWSRHKVSEGRN